MRQEQPVAIVNETFVRHYFKSAGAAIGGRVAFGGGKDLHYMTIVGVARDVRHTNLRDAVQPTLFTPLGQGDAPERLHFYLRTATPPQQMFATVRAAMRSIDAGLTLAELRTMDEQVERSIANERMIEVLALAFGMLATLLAGVGLYGVLSYTTMQRTREIGIRMALGSTRLAISGLVLKEMVRLGTDRRGGSGAVRDPAGTRAAQPTLRRVRSGPADAGRGRTVDGSGGAGRRAATGAACGERGTDGGAAGGVRRDR